MSGLIGNGVTLDGIVEMDFAWPWNISGTVVAADVGSLVAQDVTAGTTVKLLGEDDSPIGQLGSFENRIIEGVKVGTVFHKLGCTVPYTGTLAIGNSVVGSATPGTVKRYDDGAGTPVPLVNRSLVVDIDTVAGTCVIVFI